MISSVDALMKRPMAVSSGDDDVMKMAAAIQGCPVSGAWARQT